MLRLVPFENKVAEINVEYIGRQVLDPSSSSPPPTVEMCVCVCVGMCGGGSIDDPDN